jgi:hypothetical protein
LCVLFLLASFQCDMESHIDSIWREQLL